MKAEAKGTVIHFEGTEEEFAVFLQMLKEKMSASAKQFADELWNGTDTITAPKGLLGLAKETR